MNLDDILSWLGPVIWLLIMFIVWQIVIYLF